MSRRSNTAIGGGPFTIPLSGHPVARLRKEKTDGHLAVLSLARAKVSFQQAIATAEERTTGRAFEATIELDNGTPTYWIAAVANGGHIIELLVDPMDGVVQVCPHLATVSSEQQQVASLAAGTKLDLTAAIQAASARSHGQVTAASLSNWHGHAVYQVDITSACGVRQFKVDAASGKVAAVPSGMWLGFTERALGRREAI